MDYIEFLAHIAQSELLDKQGKFAEADQTIKIAQFGGFGNVGGGGGNVGNLGGMFGGNAGNFAAGALVNQAVSGRNPGQNLLGLGLGAAASEYMRKQQANAGKSELQKQQEKLKKLQVDLAKEQDPTKKTQLQSQIDATNRVITELQRLEPQAQGQPQAGGQQGGQQGTQQAQGAFPQSSQLDVRKVKNVYYQWQNGADVESAIDNAKLTPQEELLLRQMMSFGTKGQMPGQQPGGQQAPAVPGQLDQASMATIQNYVMNPDIKNRNDAWAKITKEFAPASQMAALEAYDKLKQNPLNVAPVAPVQPVPPQNALKPIVQEALDYMKKAPQGRKIDALNYFAKIKKMEDVDRQAAYKEFSLQNYILPPAKPAPKPAAKQVPRR